VIDMTPVIGSV